MNKLFQKPKKRSEIIRGAIGEICKEDKVKPSAKTAKKYNIDDITERVLAKMYGENEEAKEHNRYDVKTSIYNDYDHLLKCFNIKVVEA